MSEQKAAASELANQVWARMRDYAKATGCPLGGCVLDWFTQHEAKWKADLAAPRDAAR